MDDISAQNVFHQLSKMEQYTDDFTHIPSSNIDLGEEAGSWILTQPLHLYPRGEASCHMIMITTLPVT